MPTQPQAMAALGQNARTIKNDINEARSILRIQQSKQSIGPVGAGVFEDLVLDLGHVVVSEFYVGPAEVVSCLIKIGVVSEGDIQSLDAFLILSHLDIALSEVIVGFRVGFVDL